MQELVAGFPEQLKEALHIGKSAKLTPSTLPILNVVICGLGGSGIGGKIVSDIIKSKAPIPIVLVNDYAIPEFVGPQTLLITSSYSGDTEETVKCLEEGIRRKAKIACITSGGEIADIARMHNLDLILVPGGLPPRSCLGYSLVQLFYVLAFHRIINYSFEKEIESSVQLISDNKASIMLEAKAIATKLKDKRPVIYTVSSSEGVAIRLRQQFNENAKTLCRHHVFPELTHNELVGWRQENGGETVLILRNPNDFVRNKTRIEISKEIFQKYNSEIIEIYAQGNTPIENAVYLIHMGDWISVFMAEVKQVDPMEVKVIDYLKGELKKEA
jgi:glucose/mannose-6-phosphate isomerase